MGQTSIQSILTTRQLSSTREGSDSSIRIALSLVLVITTLLLLNFLSLVNILFLTYKTRRLGALGNQFGKPLQIGAKVIAD
jgi:hypothetical protein